MEFLKSNNKVGLINREFYKNDIKIKEEDLPKVKNCFIIQNRKIKIKIGTIPKTVLASPI